MYLNLSLPSQGTMMQGEVLLFRHRSSSSAGAAFKASMRYLPLKPISRPSPLPSAKHTSSALPMGVLHRQSMKLSLKVMRTGFLVFSSMISATRSTTFKSSPLPTLIWILKVSGIALR